MIVKYAWCGKDLGTKEPLEDTRTSHGICPECKDGLIPYPVRCDCGWFGMSDDCLYLRCPSCGHRVTRDKQVAPFGGVEIPKPETVNKKCVEVRNEEPYLGG